MAGGAIELPVTGLPTGSAAAAVSLRAFAKRLGVSHVAVGKAVKSGRLKACVRFVGDRPEIVDVEGGAREWAANARQPKAPQPTPRGTEPRADRRRRASSGAPVVTLVEAQMALTLERTKKLQIERDVAEGRLVAKALVTKEAFEAARIIQVNLLNIPLRIAGELAAETDPARVQTKLEAAIRDALEATADLLQASVNE